MSPHPDSRPDPSTASPPDVPAEFVPLSADELSHIDRQLGYFGNARFVGFYYELRGDEVIWKDGHSYGFGAGGWQTFASEVTPVLTRLGVDLGAGPSSAAQMLVIDRQRRLAYVASRTIAERFLSSQRG